MSKIRIILVDDHALFREGIHFVLSQVSHFEVLGEASNGQEFLEMLSANVPDIVLMDISMPVMDGIEATKRAIKQYHNLKIIAITSYAEEIYYHKMIKAGALGFVEKKAGIAELQKAIETVLAGDSYFPSAILQRLIVQISNGGDTGIPIVSVQLSTREKEILSLICQGFSNNEIAEKLFISPKTVDNHRTNLISKTSSRNSAHLVMFALKNKLVDL